MNGRSHYIIMVLVYITMTVFLIAYTTPVAAVFVMLVLLAYHALSYMNFKFELTEKQEQEKRQLLYQLDKTQKQTVETAGQFLSLLEVIDSGLILIDEHEDIKQVNHTFNKFFELDTLMGHNYDVLKPVKGLYKAINEAFISEIKYRDQIIFNQHYYDINISPVFEGKMYRGCLVVVHDITQLKTAETFQKQFTADVSHELKTPLSAIKGISEILTRNPEMTIHERTDFIKTIYQESTRLETILNDLLIISKMDRLDYELKLEITSIKNLITEAVGLLMPMAIDKQLTLTSEVEDARILVDTTKMKQVMINLIKNGLNYTDEGEVKVKGYLKAKAYIIEVSDTGIGIKKEEQEKVFKRFYRVDEARSRASGGSGLGLSIIKNVVKKHHGTIELHSEADKGSTFVVHLPLIEETD